MKISLPIILAFLFSSPAFAAETASTPVSVLEKPVDAPEIISGAGVRLTEDGRGFLAPSAEVLDLSAFPSKRSIIYKAGGRWPDVTKISVCWVNPEIAGDITGDIQNWVSAEFRRVAIGFSWEGTCKSFSKANQIRTYFYPTHKWNTNGGISAGGGLSYLGPINAELGGVEGRGTMNIQIAKDSVGYPNTGFKSWIIDTTRATALHEFGHALGLAHEQERNDAPVCQDQRGDLPNAGDYQFVGAYDPKSIMNYCKNGGSVSSFSEGDLQGLRTLYPNASSGNSGGGAVITQPVGSFTIKLRQNNKCLDAVNNGTGDGTPLQQYECNGSSAQSFYFTSIDSDYWTIKGTNSGRCLDVPGSSKIDGTRLQLFKCNKTNAQKFRTEDRGNGWVTLQNKATKLCLSINVQSGILEQKACGVEVSKIFGIFAVGSSLPSGSTPVSSKE